MFTSPCYVHTETLMSGLHFGSCHVQRPTPFRSLDEDTRGPVQSKESTETEGVDPYRKRGRGSRLTLGNKKK